MVGGSLVPGHALLNDAYIARGARHIIPEGCCRCLDNGVVLFGQGGGGAGGVVCLFFPVSESCEQGHHSRYYRSSTSQDDSPYIVRCLY